MNYNSNLLYLIFLDLWQQTYYVYVGCIGIGSLPWKHFLIRKFQVFLWEVLWLVSSVTWCAVCGSADVMEGDLCSDSGSKDSRVFFLKLGPWNTFIRGGFLAWLLAVGCDVCKCLVVQLSFSIFVLFLDRKKKIKYIVLNFYFRFLHSITASTKFSVKSILLSSDSYFLTNQEVIILAYGV